MHGIHVFLPAVDQGFAVGGESGDLVLNRLPYVAKLGQPLIEIPAYRLLLLYAW